MYLARRSLSHGGPGHGVGIINRADGEGEAAGVGEGGKGGGRQRVCGPAGVGVGWRGEAFQGVT